MEFYRFFKGPQEGLDEIPKRRGYIYFCYDTGNLYVDVLSDEPENEDHGPIEGLRVQVNAKAAQYLINSKGEYIDVDNLLTSNEEALPVEKGGTGTDFFLKNGVLIGNEQDPIDVVIGEGVLVSEGPERNISFKEVLPVELGGTGTDSIEGFIHLYEIVTTELLNNSIQGIIDNDFAELETQINRVIEELDNKQDNIPSGEPGQFLTFNSNGKLEPTAGLTLVNSFKGRTGAVVPQSGDYTASMVGARPDTWMPTAKDVGAATMAEVNSAIQTAVLDSWAASY